MSYSFFYLESLHQSLINYKQTWAMFCDHGCLIQFIVSTFIIATLKPSRGKIPGNFVQFWHIFLAWMGAEHQLVKSQCSSHSVTPWTTLWVSVFYVNLIYSLTHLNVFMNHNFLKHTNLSDLCMELHNCRKSIQRINVKIRVIGITDRWLGPLLSFGHASY